MTTRERMESAESTLHRAISRGADAATLKNAIDELVTAALAAGVEAERMHTNRAKEVARHMH
jgi:hypothetical protein